MSGNASEAYRLVMVAVGETNQDEAVRLLRQAIAADPEAKLAHYHLGMILAGRGLYAAAADSYRRIVERIDHDDPGVWFLLARQLQLDGDLDAALDAYGETLRRDPICEKAYLHIAQILLEHGRDPARALTCAETAMTLRREDCMVERPTFETVLAAARAAAGAGAASSAPLEVDVRGARLGELVARGERVEAVLHRHGITCAGCSGYEGQLLQDAAREAGADVRAVEAEILSVMRASGEPDGDR